MTQQIQQKLMMPSQEILETTFERNLKNPKKDLPRFSLSRQISYFQNPTQNNEPSLITKDTYEKRNIETEIYVPCRLTPQPNDLMLEYNQTPQAVLHLNNLETLLQIQTIQGVSSKNNSLFLKLNKFKDWRTFFFDLSEQIAKENQINGLIIDAKKENVITPGFTYEDFLQKIGQSTQINGYQLYSETKLDFKNWKNLFTTNIPKHYYKEI